MRPSWRCLPGTGGENHCGGHPHIGISLAIVSPRGQRTEEASQSQWEKPSNGITVLGPRRTGEEAGSGLADDELPRGLPQERSLQLALAVRSPPQLMVDDPMVRVEGPPVCRPARSRRRST